MRFPARFDAQFPDSRHMLAWRRRRPAEGLSSAAPGPNAGRQRCNGDDLAGADDEDEPLEIVAGKGGFAMAAEDVGRVAPKGCCPHA